MCYGCQPTCEDCRPKFVYCSVCGAKNFLFSTTCKQCAAAIDDAAKEAAKEEWRRRKDARSL